MRHRLALAHISTSQDATGQAVESTGATYATVWGSLEPLSAKELLNAQQQVGEVTHKAVIRYNSSVVRTDRITFDSRTFEVSSVMNPLERKARMELLLKEIV
jgi:SPP1 family predicted phage head-tail adaptor